MRSYIALFKLRFINNLQYRASAIAGIITQIFFGFVFIMIYLAFYESNPNVLPMEVNQLVTYIWLQQGFFSLIYLYYMDKDIAQMIKSGDVSYELCRPQNIYFKWFAKIYAYKISNVVLKALPLFLIAFLLPEPYGLSLPSSILSFGLFVLAIILSSILTCALATLNHILVFYTLETDGIIGIFTVLSDLLAGSVVPLLFFPSILQKIAYALPFRYVVDFPFRVYSGSIEPISAYSLIIQEVIWIIVIILFGYFLTKNATKKIVVQGG